MAAEVRVWNPSYGAKNPRKKKPLTPEQVEKRQGKAVRFLRDVADAPELADEIEDLSVREYAERKGFELGNNPPKKKKESIIMKKEELQQAVKDGVIEAFKATRRINPNGGRQAAPAATAATKKSADERLTEVVDAIDDALSAWDDGDEDEAWDILKGQLERSAER